MRHDAGVCSIGHGGLSPGLPLRHQRGHAGQPAARLWNGEKHRIRQRLVACLLNRERSSADCPEPWGSAPEGCGFEPPALRKLGRSDFFLGANSFESRSGCQRVPRNAP